MTERIRLTITVPAEAHQVFQHMAAVAGQPLGRVMGDWLADTADAATLITAKVAEAKEAPKRVMRELQAMSRGLVAEVDTLADDLRSNGWARKRTEERAVEVGAQRLTRTSGPSVPPAPSSNTGLKSPQKAVKKGRKNGI